MHKIYYPKGVCSSRIDIDLDENGVITACRFTGGCNGNTTGICRLVEGMKAEEAEKRLSGVRCGPRPTSCRDQLARALGEALAEAGAGK